MRDKFGQKVPSMRDEIKRNRPSLRDFSVFRDLEAYGATSDFVFFHAAGLAGEADAYLVYFLLVQLERGGIAAIFYLSERLHIMDKLIFSFSSENAAKNHIAIVHGNIHQVVQFADRIFHKSAFYLMILASVAIMVAMEATEVPMVIFSAVVILLIDFSGMTISQPGSGLALWRTLATMPFI